MANPTLSISASVQNAYPGNTVTKKVRQTVPPLSISLSGHQSVVGSFTGTSSHNVAISISGGTVISVDSVTQKHPITQAAFVPTNITGFCVRVERADSATAPTGSVAVQVQDFGGWNTDNDAELTEGGILLYHKERGPTISGAGTLYVKLGSTTGYKATVIVWFEES